MSIAGKLSREISSGIELALQRVEHPEDYGPITGWDMAPEYDRAYAEIRAARCCVGTDFGMELNGQIVFAEVSVFGDGSALIFTNRGQEPRAYVASGSYYEMSWWHLQHAVNDIAHDVITTSVQATE